MTWLKANDVQRRFAGRREKFFGQFVAKELDDEEDAGKRERERTFNDKMAEANDQFTFYCKKLESRGLLRKIGGLR